jgi:hypothetical protein
MAFGRGVRQHGEHGRRGPMQHGRAEPRTSHNTSPAPDSTRKYSRFSTTAKPVPTANPSWAASTGTRSAA